MSKDKPKLVEGTLSLDDIVYSLPDNCDTEVVLKIQKKENHYGISSFRIKIEESKLINKVKVFDKDENEVKI
ncbi:hypothetical protein [Clostridium beijerinckii]|uniref:hypothetical protein n=1 Tax=Clostridium beijerinckii TaxID=1520 RepID=UPI0015706A97|nr:hypothetical protein [Clostridium beijerinckii]NRU52544.1 hypothetical protein [Clostridium beijerinckii]NYC69279.1 hypothetical protein [Clostridium beijerinckii]NYC91745.1 hypothetical protein [Clostridium beijerinckii]